MATERVDKGWQGKGLEAYSDEAILGTLRHYGVAITREDFLARAARAFPLALAREWHEAGWRGTGQFSRFPAAAAEELWRRWLPGTAAPTDLALAIIKLLEGLVDRLDGKPDDGTLDTRFKVVEAFLAKLPSDESTKERFLGECFGALSEWMEPFDGMAESLARHQLDALADRFVALEETLLEQRRGVATAIVRAERGDREGAVKDIFAIAMDPARDVWNRAAAIDALADFDEVALEKQALLALFDRAEQAKDVDLLSWTVEHLSALLKEDPSMPERHQLRERIDRLTKTLGEPQDEP